MPDESNDQVVEGSVAEEQEIPSPVSGEPAARVVRRKPHWLLIPVEYVDQVDEAGEFLSVPSRYELYECATKGMVTKVLSKLGDSIKLEHVKIFRADPMPMRLQTQVTFKF